MSYTLRIFHADEISDAERQAAAQRFRFALEETLGDASLVVPMYRAWSRLRLTHQGQERPWDLSPDEQLVADQWEAAELAATQAAFGTERYLGDADYELVIIDR